MISSLEKEIQNVLQFMSLIISVILTRINIYCIH